MQDLTRLINEHIDSCSGLFYDWINWDYIRNLFYVPKYNKPNVMKDEFTKYMANIEYYPFQQYIYWTPGNHGGILSSDRKFLKLLYEMNGDVFSDYTKYRDADDDTRNNIYNFIDSSAKTAIAVDCENSNPFKLYSVLKGLNQEELARIEKSRSMMIRTLQQAGTGCRNSRRYLLSILRSTELPTGSRL